MNKLLVYAVVENDEEVRLPRPMSGVVKRQLPNGFMLVELSDGRRVMTIPEFCVDSASIGRSMPASKTGRASPAESLAAVEHEVVMNGLQPSEASELVFLAQAGVRRALHAGVSPSKIADVLVSAPSTWLRHTRNHIIESVHDRGFSREDAQRALRAHEPRGFHFHRLPSVQDALAEDLALRTLSVDDVAHDLAAFLRGRSQRSARGPMKEGLERLSREISTGRKGRSEGDLHKVLGAPLKRIPKHYQWLVVDPAGNAWAGYEYRSDAADALKDMKQIAPPGTKVMARRTYERMKRA